MTLSATANSSLIPRRRRSGRRHPAVRAGHPAWTGPAPHARGGTHRRRIQSAQMDSPERVDALLKTQGPISSTVLAEIKHHREKLLGNEYRSGCYGPSTVLSGAVVQAQQTAYRAATDLGERLADRAGDGSDLPTATFN